MKRRYVRRFTGATSVFAAVSGLLLGVAAPAHAVLPEGQVAVAAGGSDTTTELMSQIMPSLDNDGAGRTLTVDGSPTTVRSYNIPAFPLTGSGFPVPGDPQCTDVTWQKDPLGPSSASPPTKGISPFGSSSGRNYLAAESSGTGPGSPSGTDNGCIDIARSSGPPRSAGGGDRSTFRYYAYALDAMSWATTSIKAPPTLTRQQITDIYDCVIKDWGEVGGTSGPIQRYFPQVFSGTKQTFTAEILVGKAASYVPPTGIAGCPDAIFIEENQGQQIQAQHIDRSIMAYSAAVWTYHARNAINPTIDRRTPTGSPAASARLGGITTGAATPVKDSAVSWNGTNRAYQLNTAGVVKESNIKLFNPAFDGAVDYPGVRYAFNVIDTNENRRGYQAALQLVGFTNLTGGAKGPLCDAKPTGAGADQYAIILSQGFAALPATVHSTFNRAGSTCREFPGVT